MTDCDEFVPDREGALLVLNTFLDLPELATSRFSADILAPYTPGNNTMMWRVIATVWEPRT
jgi:hypothetical protein